MMAPLWHTQGWYQASVRAGVPELRVREELTPPWNTVALVFGEHSVRNGPQTGIEQRSRSYTCPPSGQVPPRA